MTRLSEDLTPADESSPRRSMQLLGDPVFGPFFLGKLLSTAGVWIYAIVAAIVAFDVSGSALVVGVVSAAQFVPSLLLGVWAGALADRTNRRVLMVLGLALVVTGCAGLSAWLTLGGADGLPNAWPIIAASLIVGVGFSLVGPTSYALLPALVREGELPVGVDLSSLPPVLGRAAGPAIGALVVSTSGPALAFGIAAVGNVAYALAMLMIDFQTHAQSDPDVDRRVRAVVAHMRTDRGILPLVIGIAAIGGGSDPAITLTPALAAHFGNGTSSLVGTFASAFGIGAAATFVFVRALRRRVGIAWLGSGGLAVIAFGNLAVGLSPNPAAATLAFVVAGLGMTAALTSCLTQLQERVSDDIRGRVMALGAIAFMGSRPLAASVSGAIADVVSVDTAFGFVSLVVLAAAWNCRPQRVELV